MKYFSIISLILLATACNSTLTTPKPQPTKFTPPYLVNIKNIGGLCPYGQCEAEYTISNTGELKKTVYEHNAIKQTYEKNTTTELLNPKDFVQLQNSIKTTNFSEILKNQFTETCPSAYDEAQNLFSFYQNNQEIQLDSCKQFIDLQNEPFKLIYQLIFK